MHQKVLRMNLNSPKIGLKELEVVFFWPETTQFLVKNGGGIGGTPTFPFVEFFGGKHLTDLGDTPPSPLPLYGIIRETVFYYFPYF